MKMYLSFLLSLFLLISSLAHSAISNQSMTKFESSITPIPISTQKIMEKYTWRANCPVPLNDLAEIKLSYWGFDHKTHQGILIVNKILASEVVSIFKAAYYHKFPIERMEPMDNFKGDDEAAMEVNNTSAFNCRAVTGKPGVFSQHSYGRAIDINTLINPYVKGDKVLPPLGKKYADRAESYPGKITKNNFIYNEFTKRGWNWGGNWHDLQDYQHFEKRANNEKRDTDNLTEIVERTEVDQLPISFNTANPYIQAATSENTRKAYQSDIKHFVVWGGLLPTSPDIIIRYLQTFASQFKPAHPHTAINSH